MLGILLDGHFMSFFIDLGFLHQMFWKESKSRILVALAVLYQVVEMDISLQCLH